MKLRIKVIIAFLILGLTAPVYAQSCSGMSLGNNASLNGFVPFPSTNVWNTNIASAPVDPNSAAITSASGFAGLNLHPDFGSESEYGIPYVVVDSSATPSVPINVVDYADQSDVVVAPYPITAPIEGDQADCTGGPGAYINDAHVLVLDRAKCWLYETFNTNRCNGEWKSSSETIWDMSNYESRPWGWTSADAAGLPVFPGLVRYDEVASGVISHALRFTMQQTKNDANDGYFVTPASHASGNLWGSNNVMGMRIRLKASFDISGFSKVNQIILTAMKQYGMILADNGGYFYFQGAPDSRWDDDDLSNLKGVASSNFEVVQATPEYPGMDSLSAYTDYPGVPPTINSFTASATTLGSGSPFTFSYSVSGDSYDFIDMIGPVAAGSGSLTVYPTATQTYTLNSTNASGRTTSDAITVTVSGSVAASPSFSPAGGTYSSAQTVSLTDKTPGAAIYYTTNGTTPTTSSTKYTGAIKVAASETIKAIAVASGYTNSAVASATYTISQPVTALPSFSPAGGTYSSVQTVSLTDKTSGAAIYYTTNGATPTASSTKYTGAIKVAASETIKAIAVASGYTNSAVASATYTISQPVTASPSFSPAGGTYSSVQTVSLTDKTSGAAIYYTTNGATPTTSSTKYTGAIKVAASETIKAIAVASGYTNSAVVSATYTINLSTLSAHGFSVAVSPASLTVSGGQSGTATTTVTPQSGFTSTVSFIC